MKILVKEYLEKLQDKFIQDENKYQCYKKVGSKLILFGNSNTKTEINQIVQDNLQDLIKEEIDKVIIIFYGITMKGFLHGPLSMVCEIHPINEKGKLSKKDEFGSIIHYTESELETRGIKSKTDFKILVKKLLNGSIESGLKKKYTAKHLDEN